MLAVVAALVLGGAVFAGTRTAWFQCRYGTNLGAGAGRPYVTGLAAEQVLPEGLDAVADLSGVGDLIGAMTTEVSLDVVDGGGPVLLTDEPFFSEPDTFRVLSLDPAAPEAGWNRGVVGQDRTIGAVDGDVVTFGAASGDVYRLRVLDGTSGSILRCGDLPRVDGAGIGRTASTLLPDGTVALATPLDNGGQALAVVDTADGTTRWETSLPSSNAVATSLGDTLLLGRYEPWEAFGGNDARRVDAADPATHSVTALDAGSGAERWHWPTDDSSSAAAIAGVTEGDSPLVLLRTVTLAPEAEDPTYDLVALDAVTGGTAWTITDVYDASVVGGVVILDLGRHAGGADVRTGEMLWDEAQVTDDPGVRIDVQRAVPWGSVTLVPTRATAWWCSTRRQASGSTPSTSGRRSACR